AEPAALLAEIEAALGGDGYAPRSLDGLRVLVTAGGTREPIDSVRYVGNRSSGRMGVALADEAARRGAEVTVIAANVSLPRSPGVRYIDVQTAAELERAARAEFESADVLLMTAAVADFRPGAAADSKIKKESRPGLSLELEPTVDVLASLSASRRPGQTLVGFAAEHGGDLVDLARGKLERKRLDAVVVNDISRPEIGFDSEDNEVSIVTRGDVIEVPRVSKAEVAQSVIDLVEKLRAKSEVGKS
ncbi:MAG: phosphopantothenoylcysteine decarboxylase, partial [Thermoleophilaceae bacterium]